MEGGFFPYAFLGLVAVFVAPRTGAAAVEWVKVRDEGRHTLARLGKGNSGGSRGNGGSCNSPGSSYSRLVVVVRVRARRALRCVVVRFRGGVLVRRWSEGRQ